MSGSESEELSVSVEDCEDVYEDLEAKQAKLHDMSQAKVPTSLTFSPVLNLAPEFGTQNGWFYHMSMGHTISNSVPGYVWESI